MVEKSFRIKNSFRSETSLDRLSAALTWEESVHVKSKADIHVLVLSLYVTRTCIYDCFVLRQHIDTTSRESKFLVSTMAVTEPHNVCSFDFNFVLNVCYLYLRGPLFAIGHLTHGKIGIISLHAST